MPPRSTTLISQTQIIHKRAPEVQVFRPQWYKFSTALIASQVNVQAFANGCEVGTMYFQTVKGTLICRNQLPPAKQKVVYV